ncbi:MAG: hypothetical protein JRG83_11580 [Deltaproteobacteria bacterium]|nr:hypothetical protein [Deltaproteobacteria bacterium]
MSKRSLLVLAACTLLATPASAVGFFDVDYLGGVKLSADGTSSYADTFDITAGGIEGDVFNLFLFTLADQGGFVPGIHQTVGAAVLLGVFDDFDSQLEFMMVEIGDLQVSTPIEVDFGIVGFGVSATLFAMINATGQLDYEIVATSGDFHVGYAALFVEAVESSAAGPTGAPNIPEANALAVYAAGVLVVAGAARRRRQG